MDIKWKTSGKQRLHYYSNEQCNILGKCTAYSFCTSFLASRMGIALVKKMLCSLRKRTYFSQEFILRIPTHRVH